VTMFLFTTTTNAAPLPDCPRDHCLSFLLEGTSVFPCCLNVFVREWSDSGVILRLPSYSKLISGY